MFLSFFSDIGVGVSLLVFFFSTEKKRRACSKEEIGAPVRGIDPSCSDVRISVLRREPPDEWRLVLRRDLVRQGPSGFGVPQLCPYVPLAGALSFRLSNLGEPHGHLAARNGAFPASRLRTSSRRQCTAPSTRVQLENITMTQQEQKERFEQALAEAHKYGPYVLQHQESDSEEWKNVGRDIWGEKAAYEQLQAMLRTSHNWRVLPKNEADKYREGFKQGREIGRQEASPILRGMHLPERL
jgi:hypothetical protein